MISYESEREKPTTLVVGVHLPVIIYLYNKSTDRSWKEFKMPKMKGLGQNIYKSIDKMDDLLVVLDKFSKAPMKQGLKDNKIEDNDPLYKMVNEAKEKSVILTNLIEDLKDSMKSIKRPSDSRFGLGPMRRKASNVVLKFLEKQ